MHPVFLEKGRNTAVSHEPRYLPLFSACPLGQSDNTFDLCKLLAPPTHTPDAYALALFAYAKQAMVREKVVQLKQY